MISSTVQSARGWSLNRLKEASRAVIRVGLERAHALWATLQLRLLQRMALETLLAFVISWVHAHTAWAVAPWTAQKTLAAMLFGRSFAEAGLKNAADLRLTLEKAQHDHATLSQAASATEAQAPDVFYYLRELDKLKAPAWHDGKLDRLRLAVTGLAVCAVETGNLLKLSQHQKVLDSIAGERTSLTDLADRVIPLVIAARIASSSVYSEPLASCSMVWITR